MCTFDIVPSLGPQSQVLHPAEASVFVQSSIPSTRSAIDTHYKYLLQNYTSIMFPQERSSTRHRCPHPLQVLTGSCPTHNPWLPIRRSGKGSAHPRCNLITNSHICGGIFQQARTTISYIPIPQISLIAAIACINQAKYGKQGIRKVNGHASSSHHTQFGSVAYLASNA